MPPIAIEWTISWIELNWVELCLLLALSKLYWTLPPVAWTTNSTSHCWVNCGFCLLLVLKCGLYLLWVGTEVAPVTWTTNSTSHCWANSGIHLLLVLNYGLCLLWVGPKFAAIYKSRHIMPPKLVSLCHTYYISHFTHICSWFWGYEIGSMFGFGGYVLISCYYT